MKGDRKMVPKSIEVTSEGFLHNIPTWCEALLPMKIEGGSEDTGYNSEVNEGRSLFKEGSNSPQIKPRACGHNEEFPNWKSREQNSKWKGRLCVVVGQVLKGGYLGLRTLEAKETTKSYSNSKAQEMNIVNIEIIANSSTQYTE